MKRALPLVGLFCLCLGAADARAQDSEAIGPSFDCRIASTYAERTICADPVLRALDLGIGFFYQSARGNRGGARVTREQREWLRATRGGCRTPECLREAMEERLWELSTSVGREMPAYRNADAEGTMILFPLGRGWYAFGATGTWSNGRTVNDAAASGVFRLVGGRGGVPGASGNDCSYSLVRLLGDRWRLIVHPPEPGAACGGLNATVQGTYARRR